MSMAWRHIDAPGVVDAFAAAAWTRILRYESLLDSEEAERFEGSLATSAEPRRRLVAAMVRLGAERGFDVPTLKMKGGLTHVEDWEWMLGQIEAASSEAEQTYWIKLLSWPFLWPHQVAQLNALLDVSSRVPALATAMGPDFEPVLLDSPNAVEQRDRWIKSKALDHKAESPKPVFPPPAERVERLLTRLESVQLRAWHLLNRALMLESGATPERNVLGWDIRALPGWESAAEQVRARITAVAVRYVLAHSPDTAGWLGRNCTPESAFSDYRAIRLLSDTSGGTELSPEVWRRWAEFVMACPGPDENDEGVEGHRRLVATAYSHAPDAMLSTLGRMIDGQNEVGARLFVLDQLPAIWDESIARLLSLKARDSRVKATCLGQLLDELLSRGAAGANELARILVEVPLGADAATRDRAVTAARALVVLSVDAGWDTVWPAIDANAAFGKQVVSAVAQERRTLRGHVFVNRLSERQVADLFISVATHFPCRNRTYGGTIDDVDELRDSLLTHLRDRGTREACEVIERVVRSLPHLDWLKWTLMDARATTRRRTWVPPRPADVVALARDRRACLVRSGDELMQAVIESLRRLQEKFQGETPAAVDVWNIDGDKPRTPKDENAFSDYVTRHLRDDLDGSNLLFAREVEIRRSHGRHSGERTDIHVNAVVPEAGEGKHRRVSLIIETKGCWNPHLETDMESQLVGRYLRENECRHGLYLVAWFFCRHWSGSSETKPKRRNWTPAEAQVAFDAQATRCSAGRVSVKALVLDATLR